MCSKSNALCPTRSYLTPSDKERASQLRSGLHTIKTTQSTHFSILRLQTQLSQEKLFQDVPIWVKRGRTEGVADSRACRRAPSLLGPSSNSRVGPGSQEDPQHPQGQQGLEELDQEKLTCGSGLHKLWYPVVRDRSTWSKFGAHGEHGDVFLFSNLGAL